MLAKMGLLKLGMPLARIGASVVIRTERPVGTSPVARLSIAGGE